ncbi:MAG: LptE family protein [Smithella sp.]
MKSKNGLYWIKTAFICFLCTLIIACGYTFAPQGDYIDKRIVNIYVAQFDNKTAQAEIENYVRSAFIDQFIQTSRFKIVENVEQADAIIKGSVLTLTTAPLSYRSSTLAAEERATMTLDVTFREKESGKDIWKSPNISGTVDYTVESNINLLPATRKAAYNKLASDTAEKIFNLMMSGF